MDKKNQTKLKVILSVLSVICLICSIIVFCKTIEQIKMNSSLIKMNINREYYYKFRLKYIALTIYLILTMLLTVAFNFFMWFKGLLGVPLTDEQLAERKRIRTARKQAKLQEQLNKLQNEKDGK